MKKIRGSRWVKSSLQLQLMLTKLFFGGIKILYLSRVGEIHSDFCGELQPTCLFWWLFFRGKRRVQQASFVHVSFRLTCVLLEGVTLSWKVPVEELKWTGLRECKTWCGANEALLINESNILTVNVVKQDLKAQILFSGDTASVLVTSDSVNCFSLESHF